MNNNHLEKEAVTIALTWLRARHGETPGELTTPTMAQFIAVLDFAGRHGVSSALAMGLRESAGANHVWDELLPFLEAIERRNSANNARFCDAAVSVADHFGRNGVRAVFLKGAAVLLEREDNAPWRTITDLDVLVRPKDLGKAVQTLAELGYSQQADHGGFEEGIHHHYPALCDNATGVCVELHIRLQQDRRDNLLATETIFDQALSVTRNEQTVLLPSPEHRMIHLIAHAQLSNWGYALRQISLKDVLDAVELDRSHKVNWDIVRKAFASINANDELVGFLWATHLLLGMRLPLQEHGSDRPKSWASRAVSALYSPDPGWRSSLRICAHYLKLFARDPARLKIIWKTLRDPERRSDLARINRGRLGRPRN